MNGNNRKDIPLFMGTTIASEVGVEAPMEVIGHLSYSEDDDVYFIMPVGEFGTFYAVNYDTLKMYMPGTEADEFGNKIFTPLATEIFNSTDVLEAMVNGDGCVDLPEKWYGDTIIVEEQACEKRITRKLNPDGTINKSWLLLNTTRKQD